MNYKDVLQVLKSRSQAIDYAGREEQVRKLVTMAIVNVANTATLERIEDQAFTFTDGRLELPVECIQVKRIRSADDDKNLRYRMAGQRVVQMLDYKSGTALVSYLRLPTDEYGPSIITDEQLEYCVAYVEKYIMRDRWLLGKMGGGEYQYFEQIERERYQACFNERLTSDQMDKIVWLVKNGRYFLDSKFLETL